MSDQKHANLLPRIARGEEGAVEACVNEYAGMVYALAKRYLEPVGGDAEDAVQEIFVEVWRCAGRYDAGLGSEAAYIATIAHRRLIDVQRRVCARPRMVGEVVEGGTGAAVGEGRAGGAGVASTIQADDLRRTAAALAQLEEQERSILLLALHRGLSHSRIAELVGIPIGTVKTRLRRGLLRVRELIGGSTIMRALNAKGGAS